MHEAAEIIRQVKRIDLFTRRLVDGLAAGQYRSAFKGTGIEFSEIREYYTSDDPRAIDWKVTARMNRPFVKQYLEERDLRVYFAFDLSASGNFGSEIEKKRKAIELAASLMFSALKNNDAVGLFLITDHVEKFVPARKGRKHVLKLLSALLSFEPASKKTDLNACLGEISKVLHRRCLLFVLSDFYSPDFSKPLKMLRARHDVVAISITDSREHNIPSIGLVEFEDEETGEQLLVDTSDPAFRANYEKLAKERQNFLTNLFRKSKIDQIDIFSDAPYEVPLRRFFHNRSKKAIY
ncbi:MAG: DUF58 domain-containing protein [Candidatus Micrarchaeia archaeon]|jgi:uncharacterized protein (DUF58 family)